MRDWGPMRGTVPTRWRDNHQSEARYHRSCGVTSCDMTDTASHASDNRSHLSLYLMYTQNIRVSGSCRQWTWAWPVSGGWRCHNSLCPTIGDSIASPIITPLAAPLPRICRDTGDTAANITPLSPGRMRYHLDTTIFQALIIIDQVWRSRYNV